MEDFIKEYFNLTGRPIATMTVNEYLAFKNAFNTYSFSPNASVSVSSVELAGTQSSNSKEKVVEKTEYKQPLKKQVSSNDNNALKLLQSIDS